MKKKLIILVVISVLVVLILVVCLGDINKDIVMMKGGMIIVFDFYDEVKFELLN